MTDKEIIQSYKPLVDFLGEVLGENCEIVLHDFENPDSSIVAISHGHLSKRESGGPMTNLLLKMLSSAGEKDYLVNYKATGPEGKEFSSSTYFIKNECGKEIGALCINFDIEVYKKAYKALQNAFGFAKDESETSNYKESFQKNTEETVGMLIDEAMKKSLSTFSDMDSDDKILFVKELDKAGVFMYKGSIPMVSRFLNVSEPTMYRYVSKIKKAGKAYE